MEARLGQELVQVVATDPPRDVRVARPHEVRVPEPDPPKVREHLRQAAPAGDCRGVGGLVVGADLQGRAAVLDDPEPLHVVHGLAREQRVAAARVVADHPAQGAPGVRRGIGAERQAVPLRGAPQVVEDDPRLHPGGPRDGIDLQDPRHVPPGVEDDRDVAGLAGQAGPRPAGQDRRVVLGADAQGGHDIVVVEREDDPQWHLPVVGRIRGVDGPRRTVEANLAPNRPPQRRLQLVAPRFGHGRAVHASAGRNHGRAADHRVPSSSLARDAASSARA